MEEIKIIQHNVLNWKERRFGLIHTYKSLNADIILINSHGVPDNKPLKIHGYTVHKKNNTNTHTDGTAIAIKHNIKYKLYDDYLSDMLAIEIESNTGNILISTLYQPPARQFIPIPDFLRIFRQNIPVYMLSDLNANHPTFNYRTTNTKGRQLNRLIQDRIIQHVGPHFPTFISRNYTSTPDIILTNTRTYHNMHITQGPLTTSDHIPIVCTLSLTPTQIPCLPRPNLRQADWEKIQNEIKEKFEDPEIIENPTLEEIDDFIDDWYTKIQDSINNNIPLTIHKNITHTTLRHETKVLTIQYQAIKTEANTHGWTQHLYRNYLQIRQQLHRMLIEDSVAHWNTIVTDTINTYKEPKTFWRKLKQLKGTDTSNPPYLTKPNGEKIYKDSEKEKLLREIWEEVYTDHDLDERNETEEEVRQFLNLNQHKITPYHTGDINRLNSDNNFLTFEITNDQITNIIKAMKSTCPGNSGINKIILKNLPEEAITRLKHIFNASLSAGYFPDKFKTATIKFIPKQGKNIKIPTNYRPISLLEVPGKLFERIINYRIKIHLEDNLLHNSLQFGFRSNHGTAQALALASETMAQHKADGGQCHVVLRDITKAFDRVWHLGLKYKILHLGLPDILERLLCDFLDDRMARIRFGSHLGPPFELQCGVPQGSVLSPTLFTIYTRDLPPPLTGTNISYADDITQISGYRGRSLQMAQRRTGREIENINIYEENWKIETNINKFTVIRLGSRKNEQIITHNDNIYETTNKGKILGLNITSSGYNKHIEARKNQAIQTLTKLYRFQNMPTNIKVHLVKTLILPVLDYPPIPTHAMSQNQLSQLQITQNKALRFAFNQRYPYTHNTIQLHQLAKIDPINVRLYNRAVKIWETIERQHIPLYTQLTENIEHIENYHTYFPSSLMKITNPPLPVYH